MDVHRLSKLPTGITLNPVCNLWLRWTTSPFPNFLYQLLVDTPKYTTLSGYFPQCWRPGGFTEHVFECLLVWFTAEVTDSHCKLLQSSSIWSSDSPAGLTATCNHARITIFRIFSVIMLYLESYIMSQSYWVHVSSKFVQWWYMFFSLFEKSSWQLGRDNLAARRDS